MMGVAPGCRKGRCDNPARVIHEPRASVAMDLMPREGKFFDFFNEHADLAAQAALELQALFSDLSQLE